MNSQAQEGEHNQLQVIWRGPIELKDALRRNYKIQDPIQLTKKSQWKDVDELLDPDNTRLISPQFSDIHRSGIA